MLSNSNATSEVTVTVTSLESSYARIFRLSSSRALRRPSVQSGSSLSAEWVVTRKLLSKKNRIIRGDIHSRRANHKRRGRPQRCAASSWLARRVTERDRFLNCARAGAFSQALETAAPVPNSGWQGAFSDSELEAARVTVSRCCWHLHCRWSLLPSGSSPSKIALLWCVKELLKVPASAFVPASLT
jgi:hypothetical protein